MMYIQMSQNNLKQKKRNESNDCIENKCEHAREFPIGSCCNKKNKKVSNLIMELIGVGVLHF